MLDSPLLYTYNFRPACLRLDSNNNMADAVKDAVNSAVEGVKELAVSAEQKAEQKGNKAPKPKKEKKAKGDAGDGRPLMLDPAPAFIDHRIKIL